MYYGQVPIGTSTWAVMITTANSSRTPTAADTNAVTYRIYAPSSTTVLLTGSFSTTPVDSGNAPGLYQATNIAITVGNGFAASNLYHMRISYAISSTTYVDEYTFQVV